METIIPLMHLQLMATAALLAKTFLQ